MTARNERAVRGAPGNAADRRQRGVGSKRHGDRPRGKAGLIGLVDVGPVIPTLGPVELRSAILEATPSTSRSPPSGESILQLRVESPQAATPRESSSFTSSSKWPTRSEPRIGESKATVYRFLFQLEHHRGAFEVLFLLLWEDRATLWRMRSALRPGPQAIRAALESLIRLGLVEPIESAREATFPFGRPYRLSGRGRSLLQTRPDQWFSQPLV